LCFRNFFSQFKGQRINNFKLFLSKELIGNIGLYGKNEVYYIGAYMANTLGEYPKLHNNKIPREYALYADYIIKKSREYEFSNKDVDCDLLSLLRKYPLKAPITCQ
jgi:hypothetical protein